MIDYNLALMCGTDIPVPECQITIHQPRIKEIALIGEKDFFRGAQSLCVDKKLFSKDERVLENTNNFQIFMTVMNEKETRDKKEAVIQLCSLLFPNYKILITPRSVIAQKDDVSVIIDETNFEILQSILKDVFCFTSSMNQDTFNPADKKAQEIAEKLMRGRERIAAEKGGDNGSALIQYTSILTIGLGISLQEIFDLTIFQLYDLVHRYMMYVNWDIDVRTRLAGGKPDSQPDNWMKNIH